MFQAIPSKNVNSKGLLASRIGSLFKSGPLAKHELFKPVELAALESNMKSDFVNNLWFFKLMSAVMDEGKSITMEEKEMYDTAIRNKPRGNINIGEKRKKLENKLERLRTEDSRTRLDVDNSLAPSPAVRSIQVDLETCCYSLQQMGKDTSIKKQCSDTIEHIHDLFENLPDVASIEIDDYVSELAILHHQEDTSTIAVKESEKLRKKLIRYYMQLSEVRRLLAETKLYYESEDKLWLTEINMLAGECNRAHEKAILIHRNNVHDGLKLAVKLASTRLPEAPLSRDEIDVLLDEVKAALKI